MNIRKHPKSLGALVVSSVIIVAFSVAILFKKDVFIEKIFRSVNCVNTYGEEISIQMPTFSAVFDQQGPKINGNSNGPRWIWTNTDKATRALFERDKISYDHKWFKEQYIIRNRTIEQQFIIDQPVQLFGEVIQISGQIESNGEFFKKEKSWAWTNKFGEVSIGDVYTYDASGREIPSTMTVSDSTSTIEIKTSDLVDAIYPITIDPEIGANDFRISKAGVDGDASNYSATSAAIAYNAVANKYLIVYTESLTGEDEVYGQLIDGTTGLLFDPDGNASNGKDIRISTMGSAGITYGVGSPDVVATSGSSFFVVWSGDDNTGTLADDEFEIYGQFIDGNGLLSGSRVRISNTGTDGNAALDASNPAVAYNVTNDRLLVTWFSDQVSDNQFEIYFQAIEGNGTLIGSNTRVSTMGTDPNSLYDALRPDIAWNSADNQYLIAWHGDLQAIGDGQNEAFIRRIDGTSGNHGNFIGSQILISDMGPAGNTAYGASDVSISYSPTNNNYLVVWYGDDDTSPLVDNENEIFGQFVSSTGTTSGINNFFRISHMGTDGSTLFGASNPVVSYDPNLQQFLVAWQGDDNIGGLIDNEFEIFGQLIQSNGVLNGSKLKLSDAGDVGNTTYSATFPAIDYNAFYRTHLVVWQGDDNAGTTADNEIEIWGQLFAVLSPEPTTKPSVPSFTSPTSSSFTVNYSAASGTPDGYIVLRNSTSSPVETPSDNQTYSVNDPIGVSGTTVAYIGNGLTFNQSGFAANTTYYYTLFSYDGVNSSTNYLTSSPPTGNVTTLFAEPTVQGTLSFSSFGTNSIQVNLAAGNGSNRLLIAKAGSAVDAFPVDGNAYTPNNNIASAPDLGSSNFVVGSGTGSVTVSGLSPAIVYHFKVVEFNGTSTLTNYNTSSITNSTGSKSTLSTEPTTQPTGPVNFTSVTNTSFTVGFTAASPTPSGYIAIRRSGSAPAQPADLPIDGTTYTLGEDLGSSKVVYIGSGASFSQSVLTAGTEYFYLILSYNGSGSNINYRQTTPLSSSKFTLSDEPTSQANTISFSAPGTTTMTVGWTNGNGNERLVVVKEGSAVDFTPVDGVALSGNSNFFSATDQGSGNKVVFKGNGSSVAITNLAIGTVYHFRVYELNGSALTTNYLTTAATLNPTSRTTLVAEPTAQPSALTFNSITATSMNGSFVAAAGPPSGYIVLRKSGASPTELPVDGTTYTAGTSTIGSSAVIYINSTPSFSSTGLSSGGTYYYDVFAYNGSGASINYRTTSPLEGSQLTLVVEPLAQPTAMTFSGITTTSMDVSFTAATGSPLGYLVLRRDGISPTEAPVDGIGYAQGSTFGLSKVVYNGLTPSFSSTGLSPGTVYHYDVFAYNGTGAAINYLSVGPLENNRITLSGEPTAQPSAFNFSAITSSSVNVSFTGASGSPTGYLVLRKTDSAPTEIPVDGVEYSGSFGTSTLISAGSATSFSNAGLEPGTIYNYVAYAFNGSGQSINYFIALPLSGVVITLPPAPFALEAGSILTNSFKAKWIESKSATAYELDVSLSSTFDALITGYSAKVITGVEETVNGILSDKTYYYRIRAKNTSGLSANSNSTSVTTLKDSNTQPLTISAPDFANSPTTKINVTISGGSGTRLVKFFSKAILATDYVQRELQSSSNTYEITVTPDMLDDFGLEFYFTASDATTTASIKTTTFYIYKPIIANEKSIQGLSSGGGIENYRIISVPYKLEDNTVLSVFGSLGNYDKSIWRIVHYQNEKNVDYPTFTKIDQGVGYWFNSISPAEIKLGTGTVPPFNQENPFKMNLSKGWNQIGDPYPFDVDWDDVLTANAGKTVGKLNVYNPGGGILVESNSLKAWSGGFVFADNDVADFSFPVTLKNTAGGRKSQSNEIVSSVLDEEQWLVPLTLTQGIGENNAIGIGMHPHASASKDQFDAVTVPRFFNYLEMSTHHNEFFAPQFSRDVVPTIDQFTWSFTASSNLNANMATLKWNPETFGNGAAQLILHDEANQLFIDMRSVNRYDFDLRADRKFRIIYSVTENGWNPGITLLGKPFPNPSAASVTIPIVMKEAGWVVVDVVDLNGKKIKTLAKQEYAMGVHDLTWLGDDESLIRVPGGMYLVQMKTSKGSPQTQKIVIK